MMFLRSLVQMLASVRLFPFSVSMKHKRRLTVTGSGALFDATPAELLQNIAEFFVDPKTIIIWDNTYHSSTKDLLKRCCFSAKFASAVLKVYIRLCTLETSSDILLHMAQTAADAPLIFWTQPALLGSLSPPLPGFKWYGPYGQFALNFSACKLRSLEVNIQYPYFPFGQRNKDYVGLAKIIPRLHTVFQLLDSLGVHIAVYPEERQNFEEHQLGDDNGMRVFAHSRILLLAVALNRAQKHIRHTSLEWLSIVWDIEDVFGHIGRLIPVSTVGSWADVMARLCATPLFADVDGLIQDDKWFVAWCQLGGARTELRGGGSRGFVIDDDVVSEDGPGVLWDHLVRMG